MMIKRMTLLAGAALAVVAFAAPAASAAWTHSGATLGENTNFELSGPMNFEVVGWAGFHAGVIADVTLEPGKTATVTSFKDTNCTGTGGLNGLTCTWTAESLPWIAHIEGGKIKITNIKLTNHYYSPLDPSHTMSAATTVLTGNILATPNNAKTISSVTLAGEGTIANGNPALVNGTLGVTPAGTYGSE